MPIRQRLGSFGSADWDRREASLVSQGLSPVVLRQLVSGSARNLLPGRKDEDIPPEPFRQLWYAAAEQTLANIRIEPIEVPSSTTQLVSAEVAASGARLFPIRLPAGHALVLGVNGTPLLQMSVFAADGRRLEAKGPLRVVNLGFQKSSPVQLLITNEGVAPAEIRLSLRADPPPPPAVPPPPEATDTTGTETEAPSGTENLPASPAPPAPTEPPSATPPAQAPATEVTPPNP
jgi:serine/threonine-protein kinase